MGLFEKTLIAKRKAGGCLNHVSEVDKTFALEADVEPDELHATVGPESVGRETRQSKKAAKHNQANRNG